MGLGRHPGSSRAHHAEHGQRGAGCHGPRQQVGRHPNLTAGGKMWLFITMVTSVAIVLIVRSCPGAGLTGRSTSPWDAGRTTR
jgi:hypothetical protein